MVRLLLGFMTALALMGTPSVTPTTAQGDLPPCPAVAGLMASPIASPAGSPVASPVETKGSPTASATTTATVSTSPTAVETCVVVIEDFAFTPQEIEIPAGTMVVWMNKDSAQHSATADDGSFDTDVLSRNQSSAPVTFDTPGDVPYHCKRHPVDMTGIVHVTP
jgi:plastocyanin